jgi:hypothetical protein
VNYVKGLEGFLASHDVRESRECSGGGPLATGLANDPVSNGKEWLDREKIADQCARPTNPTPLHEVVERVEHAEDSDALASRLAHGHDVVEAGPILSLLRHRESDEALSHSGALGIYDSHRHAHSTFLGGDGGGLKTRR